MKTTKEKADELVSKFYDTYESLGLKYRLYKEDCVYGAILSVKHTIEVLEQIQDKNIDDDIDNYHITMQIFEQTELLIDLESRI